MTIHIPPEEAFVVGSTSVTPGSKGKPIYTDFVPAPEVEAIGGTMIQSGPLTSLDDGELIIDYRWKRQGGTSGGNLIFGKCVRLSGVAKHYAKGAHFLIWLAADHCEAYGYDDKQIEALVYHELLHVERDEDEDKDGNPIIRYRTRGHDAEVFFDEIARYGAWSSNRARLIDVVRQLPLPIEVPV